MGVVASGFGLAADTAYHFPGITVLKERSCQRMATYRQSAAAQS